MSTYTRRTHIVRIALDSPPAPAGKKPSRYMDVEVLDAIAFRKQNGDEVILNNPAANAVPYIVDNTGGGNGSAPNDATERTHMKRLTGSSDATQMLDVEVMDCMAFRDQNGEEWILDMIATSGDPDVFDTTDNSGDVSATRRVHDEVITSPFGKSINATPKPTNYVTVQRMDTIAFRKVLGQEVIFVCPSNDDPNSGDPRASTFTWSPSQAYNPADTSTDATVPPTNTDPHVYLSAPSGSKGINLKDTKISQGPFWWVRAISGGGDYLVITIDAGAATDLTAPPPPTFSIRGPSPDNLIIAEKPVTTSTFNPGTPIVSTNYFVWMGAAEFPTKDTFSVQVGPGVGYGTQFSQFIADDGLSGSTQVFPPGAVFGDYATLAGAQAGAAWLTDFIGSGNSIQWYGSNGDITGPAVIGFFGTSLIYTVDEGVFGSATSAQKFLYGPLSAGDNFTYSVTIVGANDASGVQAQLYIGVPGDIEKSEDITTQTGVANGSSVGVSTTFTVKVSVGTAADGSDSTVTVTGGGGGGAS